MKKTHTQKMISGRISMCLQSNNKTQQLGTQLDQLHSEYYSTRTKAKNARFRVIRLSEAAENLCKQAAKNIQKGEEDEARDILVQKKKVMVALEKSKVRVQLLDELAAKLNEAISIKEAQLAENALEADQSDPLSPVHIVSPPPISLNINESNPDENHRLPETFDCANNSTTMISKFSGNSSYIDFLHDLDLQLGKILKDLEAVSEDSKAKLKSDEKLVNSEVLQISDILDRVRDTRARIHGFIEQNETTS